MLSKGGFMDKTNYLLRDIPKDVYEKIKKNAEKNDRSVNKEILNILKKVRSK